MEAADTNLIIFNKMTVAQLVNKFTRRFIILSTRARHLSYHEPDSPSPHLHIPVF
jgi:hypothetical protein